jgi:TonB family protein
MISRHARFAATNAKEREAKRRTLSEEEAVRLAIFAPAPRYPYEARAEHMQGTGSVRLDVETKTGYVTSAQIVKSKGHQMPDDEALKAFRAWRFKPEVPIQFTSKGVFY